MIVEGVIESINGKAARNTRGAYTTYIIKLRNHPKNLSTFDDAVGKALEVAKAYSFEVEQKGEYLNVVKGTMPEEIAFPLQGTESTPPMPDSETDKNISIQRQVALKAAVEMTGYHIQHTSRKYAGAAAVLSIAGQFAAWLSGGPAPTFDPDQAERDKALYEEQSGPLHPPEGSDASGPQQEKPPAKQGPRLPSDKRRQDIQAILENRFGAAAVHDWTHNFYGVETVAEIPEDKLNEALEGAKG